MNSLRPVLFLNSASCLSFGIVFLLVPHAVAAFLGDTPATVLRLVGSLLVVNGGHLILAARRNRVLPVEVLWFSLGDLAWWLASLFLLGTGFWITTQAGKVATWGVAMGVAGLGLVQLFTFGQRQTGVTRRAHWHAIGASWVAMPRWVKFWLFALNGVFLAAIAFWPSDLARVVLTAYVASGPLLAALAFAQGGLTRLAGVGHLAPWIPLLAWLGAGGVPLFEAQYAYAGVLAVSVGICLAFDVFDVIRWAQGDRAVFGQRP